MVQSSPAPDGVHPICPYCQQQVEGVYTQEIRMSFGKTWLFFCTKCSKVLGTSQRKTVPMG
jgi:hypothetical protein